MPVKIKPKVKVIDKKERQRRLEIVAKASRGSYAMVGVQNASRVYPGEDVTLGQVAAWMEFGTKGRANGKGAVPARSFLRTPIDNAEPELNKIRERVLEQIVTGKMAIADALETLGFFVSNRCKNAIYLGISPELKDSTRASKRSNRANKGVSSTPDTPLMDTHFLVDSIGYEVVLAGNGGGES